MKRMRPKRATPVVQFQPLHLPWGICPECGKEVKRFEQYMLHADNEFFHSICRRIYTARRDNRVLERVQCPDCGNNTYMWFIHYYHYCHVCKGVQHDNHRNGHETVQSVQ